MDIPSPLQFSPMQPAQLGNPGAEMGQMMGTALARRRDKPAANTKGASPGPVGGKAGAPTAPAPAPTGTANRFNWPQGQKLSQMAGNAGQAFSNAGQNINNAVSKVGRSVTGFLR